MTTRINKTQRRFEFAFASVGMIAVVTSCSYPNQFRNVSADAPHAVLVGRHVHVFAINQQPTTFWRCGERFRVPPGKTTVNPITGSWDFRNYPALEFTAIVGYRYKLMHQVTNHCHSVLLRECPPGESVERVMAQVQENQKKRTE